MSLYNIIKYSSNYFEAWNTFVVQSKTPSFLFHRDFIEYHNNRFADFSLMIFKGKKLVALLPANKVDHAIYSHQGLTYGGLIFGPDLKFKNVVSIFKETLAYLSSMNFNLLKIKLLPSVYSICPNDELLYLMFLLSAKLEKREALSVVNLNEDITISKNRLEGYQKGLHHNLKINDDDAFEEFWTSILSPRLQKKYHAKPVHSLEEIMYLKTKFPKYIRQYNVYYKGKLVAGCTLFVSQHIVKTQYIAGSDLNTELGSIDYLFVYLLKKYKNKQFFDFGSSNLENGKKVNDGLQFWKEGFGARTIVQDFYSVNTKDHNMLDNVMV